MAHQCFYKITTPRQPGSKGPATSGAQANMVTCGADSSETAIRSVSFIPEVNMTQLALDWWIDTGASIHVCSDRS